MQKSFLITEQVPDFFTERLKLLGFKVDFNPGISLPELEKTISLYNGILIRSRIVLNREILTKASNLKYILRPGSGLDIIDVETAREKDIKIINSPEGNRDSVAEHAMGLLLGMLNNIPRAFSELSDLKWTRKENIGNELGGKTIGIIGYGNTGSAFADRLKSFNVKLLVYDKYKTGFGNEFINEVKPEEIFKNADIVSYHIPLTDETRLLISEEYLQNFKKPVYLLNTSRGKILNTKDLLGAIISGKVTGAALDVFENENFNTLTENDQNILKNLISTGRVILTPHIAGLTHESEIKIFSVILDKLELQHD
jgi:D-3-phosphoglycerate dehydrogenase